MKVEITTEVDFEETLKNANLVLKKTLEDEATCFPRSVIIATIAQINHLLNIREFKERLDKK